jgi:hypothetical protein
MNLLRDTRGGSRHLGSHFDYQWFAKLLDVDPGNFGVDVLSRLQNAITPPVAHPIAVNAQAIPLPVLGGARMHAKSAD